MYKQLGIACAALALFACSEQPSTQEAKSEAKAPASENALGQYKTQATSLLANIREQKSAAALEQESAELVATSRDVLANFVTKYPQCKDYLDALDKAADVIPTLPLEEIESGYHEDGKLPKYSDPVCYHAKDLLVHPATVQAIAKLGFTEKTHYQDAELEIVEVIAHFDQVERALN
ncbi:MULTISPECIES: hypothetical protein [Pseudoalteromonas]|uniref:Uncharacterized protein n=1 Tax=Pseudoalteromonas luteoviolacea (strain 2ta16) TaxID=1353533 RepID=V4HZG7_PSEL2|nr:MULTISPECIES: hypothetical protein [Pseudoalteromonas]ESP95208.1 hypothetical protein PL2TA16_04464 [Pseudoalteromonas luteoviolacea 2ta16]KZN42379.1 hypothetical protein N483_12720 [Pseudoalteromonas luteoviolacea NCIMB 1944]MCG7547123.1 hypothetical protein [Pseudoalteromonas sp. Of7M-16]